MGSFFCKIWRFLVGFITAVVELVKDILVSLLDVVFTVLDKIVEGASSLLDSILGSPLMIAAIGLGLWWLLSDSDEEKAEKRNRKNVYS